MQYILYDLQNSLQISQLTYRNLPSCLIKIRFHEETLLVSNPHGDIIESINEVLLVAN